MPIYGHLAHTHVCMHFLVVHIQVFYCCKPKFYFLRNCWVPCTCHTHVLSPCSCFLIATRHGWKKNLCCIDAPCIIPDLKHADNFYSEAVNTIDISC